MSTEIDLVSFFLNNEKFQCVQPLFEHVQESDINQIFLKAMDIRPKIIEK